MLGTNRRGRPVQRQQPKEKKRQAFECGTPTDDPQNQMLEFPKIKSYQAAVPLTVGIAASTKGDGRDTESSYC